MLLTRDFLFPVPEKEGAFVMSSIPSSVFDVLILIIIAVGLVLAARQIRHDFRLGPRFPDAPPELPKQPTEIAVSNTAKSKKGTKR
jgi:hypothetical protein